MQSFTRENRSMTLPGPKPTAVVVDDSLTARKLLRSILEQAGFDVLAEGERGDQAIMLYEQYRPALITLDIIMPILDGITAAAAILRRHPDAVVVMCSSLSAREKILACRELGVKHFILKPLDPDAAGKVIQTVVEQARAPRKAEVSP
jgi:two-component system chemotaxis response regulator CheY